MKFQATIAGFASLLALTSAAQGQFIATNCLERPQAEGLMTYALPAIISGIATQCSQSLPATSALVQSGPIIAGRYQVEADKAWPAARAAIDRMAGFKIASITGEAGTKKLIKMSLSKGISEQVKPSDCPKIDRLLNILQPLPAQNMAAFFVAMMEFSGGKENKNPIKICPIPAEAGA
jgi:hypothetical protein